MNKLSFLMGVAVGVLLSLVVLVFTSGLDKEENDFISFAFEKEETGNKITDPVEFFKEAVSYENKTEANFQISEVLVNGALAKESMYYDDPYFFKFEKEQGFHGKEVYILGDDFYCGQFLSIKNPKRIGKYKNYLDNIIPVIDGRNNSVAINNTATNENNATNE